MPWRRLIDLGKRCWRGKTPWIRGLGRATRVQPVKGWRRLARCIRLHATERVAKAGVLVIAGLVIGGCAGDDPVGVKPSGVHTRWPACAEILHPGADIAPDARGCINSAGGRELFGRLKCDDGSFLLSLPDDSLWAVNGEVVYGSLEQFFDDEAACRGA